jgi:bifunctional UDP-N-acetylglucosamine pyrophosphorylase/glucosamine-1-phosphate N-acetyltransferase
MRSTLPKVLHPLAGWPMIKHVHRAALDADFSDIIAITPAADRDVGEALPASTTLVEQPEPLGTGHAVAQARDLLAASDHVVVLNGDVPLITPATLKSLVDLHETQGADVSFLTALVEDAAAYGRVQRDSAGSVVDVVEASEVEGSRNGSAEINTGQYCFRTAWLQSHLDAIPKAPNGEYYLTSLIGIATRESANVQALVVEDPDEVRGINDRIELSEAERVLRSRITRRHMLAGVTFVDPSTAYVDAGVAIGNDSVIGPNTYLRGNTVVGMRCTIERDADVADSVIGDDCRIVASTVEASTLDDHVEIGPYSHIRPGSHLCSSVHVGNFAEVKNSRLGPGVKMGHHSYIGDADVGNETNIGAGAITCNFDGQDKHRTTIGYRVFIGSDTMLVAPVTIGDDARTGAGSVVTKDVPEGALAVGAPARITRNAHQRRPS